MYWMLCQIWFWPIAQPPTCRVQFYIVVFYYYFPHIAPQKSIQVTPTVHIRAVVFLNSYFMISIQDVLVHHDLNKNLKITRWGVKNINKFLVLLEEFYPHKQLASCTVLETNRGVTKRKNGIIWSPIIDIFFFHFLFWHRGSSLKPWEVELELAQFFFIHFYFSTMWMYIVFCRIWRGLFKV